MKISVMYELWKESICKENDGVISPLYSSLWIARKFNFTYFQAKKLYRMFWGRLVNGM